MIRNDYVSNSSSCSFVVKNIKNVDKRLCEILRRFEIHFIKRGSKHSEELIDEMEKEHKGFKLEFDDYITCKGLDINELPFINKILKECNNEFEVDFGIDDCGEYTALASQIGTLIEYIYGCEIDSSDSDSFYYTSIKKIFNEKEAE